ncbi:hypothetical protein [Weissella cibaria]|uniref:hypothetical protein n=1 Tax=Weissella cibaria TaxID=137591 RepID=UPI000D0B03FB|nr:hypothetical protein [Weissella cibaria]AVO66265.1 hypothetical protein C6N67_04185 [Weissella cibaria]NKN31302.1 hypothetical protein [Weissella cibaria]NKN80180.1 hypothetical protein [Weissella cibaria]NKN98338.1 hypothetical protein [Weissella cibaria]NKO00479.1 hypothetical protein [Weissella cibaria]
MAIAGIKPEYEMRALIEHAPAYVPHGFALYPEEQVRDILIKFSNEYILFIDDDTVEEIVGEFMESEDHA